MKSAKKDKKHSLRRIGHATLGGLVGFNFGIVLGPINATRWVGESLFSHASSPEEFLDACFIAGILAPYWPLIFAASPFYGAVMGAKIGLDAGNHYGFQYSFFDVPCEMFTHDPDAHKYRTSNYVKRHKYRDKQKEKNSSRFFSTPATEKTAGINDSQQKKLSHRK